MDTVNDIRLISGHYWPCTSEGHPRDCPECSKRYTEAERDNSAPER